jgi:hypothetical protein
MLVPVMDHKPMFFAIVQESSLNHRTNEGSWIASPAYAKSYVLVAVPTYVAVGAVLSREIPYRL